MNNPQIQGQIQAKTKQSYSNYEVQVTRPSGRSTIIYPHAPSQEEACRLAIYQASMKLNETIENIEDWQTEIIEPQPHKIKTNSVGTEYWTYIKGWQAKNWDGSSAGYHPGTPEGDKELLEKKFVPHDLESFPIRYTNFC